MIYLDHSATAPLCDAAKKAIINHLDDYGNPSSTYELGRQSRILIENAREKIAKCINAEPNEIYFTSGGSEANTWALRRRIYIASKIEHHSIRTGLFNFFPVGNNGIIDASHIYEDIRHANYLYYFRDGVRDSVDTISSMYVNNEIGTIQPIKEISRIAHENNCLFHTDAVQATAHTHIDVKDLNCDMMSISGHKIGAMKGIGALFIKRGVVIDPLICGGKQESGLRPGTENILGILSMAAAFEDTVVNMEERNEYVKGLRDKMLNQLLQIKGSHLNGSLENRVVSNINIRFDGVSGSRLVTLCNLYGICISSGSACNEGTATPSHVLKAIGLSDEEALSSVRITIGHENTEQEIDTAVKIITDLVERIRCDK